MALTHKSKKSGNRFEIELVGTLDEDSNLGEIKTEGESEIAVSFEKLEAINSCGVREWIKWLKNIPGQAKISYKNCPPTIVEQVNMVAGFLPKSAKVESLLVPYFCPKCNLQEHLLFSEGKEWKGQTLSLTKHPGCKKCGNPMEMDVLEAKYFRFLTGA